MDDPRRESDDLDHFLFPASEPAFYQPYEQGPSAPGPGTERAGEEIAVDSRFVSCHVM